MYGTVAVSIFEAEWPDSRVAYGAGIGGSGNHELRLELAAFERQSIAGYCAAFEINIITTANTTSTFSRIGINQVMTARTVE